MKTSAERRVGGVVGGSSALLTQTSLLYSKTPLVSQLTLAPGPGELGSTFPLHVITQALVSARWGFDPRRSLGPFMLTLTLTLKDALNEGDGGKNTPKGRKDFRFQASRDPCKRVLRADERSRAYDKHQ